MRVFRIIPEFRILRLTFCGMNSVDYDRISDLIFKVQDFENYELSPMYNSYVISI